jgi:phage/plasmid-like protein (TIGR03299 family)
MTHFIAGDMFYTLDEPAWHSLGHVATEKQTASEVADIIGAKYPVTLEKLRLAPTKASGIPGINIPGRVILRHPIPSDPQYKVMGKPVSEDYGLITPTSLMDIWDHAVGAHIETMGVLKDGEIIFITTKMVTISVAGDEVEMYLLAVSPMTGGNAAEIRVTPVRVVCWNTLVASAAVASERHRIIHDQKAPERMGEWMNKVYMTSQRKVDLLKDAFNIMAGHQMKVKEFEAFLATTYPLPPMPRDDCPPEHFEMRVREYEGDKRSVMSYRDITTQLFEGAGTGLDLPRVKGTSWAAYNAAVENEDKRKGKDLETVTYRALFGPRAQVKERAFEGALAVAGGLLSQSKK